MKLNLTDQARWIIGAILLSVGSILFVVGWTSPFWPPDAVWWGLPWVKTIFPLLAAGTFVVLFFISLWVLSKTTPSSSVTGQISES